MVQCWLSLEKKGPEQSDDTARTVADGAHRRSNVRAELQQKQLLKTELLGEEVQLGRRGVPRGGMDSLTF